MRNTVLTACLAALSLAACNAGQNARAHRPPPSSQPPPLALLLPSSDGLEEHPTSEVLSLDAEAPTEPAGSLALPHEEHLYRVDHLARARSLQEEGDLSGALTEARRALHDAADDLDALDAALLAVIDLARLSGQPQLAADAYGQLAWLYPDGPDPLVQRARLLLELGDTEGALVSAEDALELDPEFPETYQVLGRAHLIRGELPEAIARFRQAVHLDPYHGYALNNLGLAYLRTGQDALAAESLALAAYLLPHVAYVHNNLGLAYERIGRLEEARMAYDTALRLAPGYLKARLNLDRLNPQAHASVDLPALLGGHRSPGCPD